jgi:hypothetical protein
MSGGVTTATSGGLPPPRRCFAPFGFDMVRRGSFGRSLGNRAKPLVETDPARQGGRLASLWAALRLDGWRRIAIGLIPLALALVLAFVHQLGWLQGSDLRLFDLLTRNEAGRPPAVLTIQSDPAFEQRGPARHGELARAALALGATRVAFRSDPGFDPAGPGFAPGRIVVAREVEKLAGRDAWQIKGLPPPPGAIAAARVVAAAEAGLHRRQLSWLQGSQARFPVFESAAAGTAPAAQDYLLRLSRRQNLPEVTASQLLGGDVDRQAVAGLVVLVAPPASYREALIETPRPRSEPPMTLTRFNAAAIQTLATGRAVQELPQLASTLLLTLFGLISGLIYLRSDPKRIVILLLVTGLALTAAGTWLALALANLLLPASALVLLQPLAALLVLHRAALSEDRNLRQFVTQTVNLSSRQSLLKDYGRMPEFLAATAPALGIANFALFEATGRRGLAIQASAGRGAPGLEAIKTLPRRLLQRARRSAVPLDVGAALPDWPGQVRLAALGPAGGETYWLYGFPPGDTPGSAFHAAAGIAQDYRAIQQLRTDLREGSGQRQAYRPTDEWAGGAVRLIAERGDQVSAGLDRLETAVMVFHPIGFPIHGNAPMARLYAAIGLSLSDTTLPALLAALSDLDAARIGVIVNDLLLHGGEMRVICRDLDSRSRMLRVAAPLEAVGNQTRTLVVEAIDVSEPRRLAQLRLRVSHMLDVSIRNDLEAMDFALAAVRSGKLTAERLDRAYGQLEQAAARVTGRLDEIAPLLGEELDTGLHACFPIDAAAAVREADERAAADARDLGITVEISTPAISGFTIADPEPLVELVEAMLRIVLADAATGEAVSIEVTEAEKRTRIAVSGGIGMDFQRLYAAFEQAATLAPGPFKTVARGMATALGWGATVTYSTQIGKGYRFTIEMRRIG